MADIAIRSLLEWWAWTQAEPLREPGWYEHAGRVFIQGAVDLAPAAGTDLTEGEEAAIESGEQADVPALAEGVLLVVPEAYGPRDLTPIALHVDPYYTTPSFMDTVATCVWVPPKDAGGAYWLLQLEPTAIPKGKYGELRLILSCWWDTPAADHPGAGDNDPFLADGDFSDGPEAGIANKGTRVWLSGELECGGAGEDEPPLPAVLLHNGAPVGPQSRMRDYTAPGASAPLGYPPSPSPDYPDGVGYTIGQSSGQGPAVIEIDRRLSQIQTGVFPTDRYTFYDVRPIPGHSIPQLGRYRTPGIANPQDTSGQIVGMSGPPSGDGMSLFIGDVSAIPQSKEEPLSLYLCVPPGAGGAGQGYYRFDLLNLVDPTFDWLVFKEPYGVFVNPKDVEGPYAVDPEWEVDHLIHVSQYKGPKVIFNTVNWASPALPGMEAPHYFSLIDVTGNGHKYMPGSGWGWFPIPPGPKSVLISVTNKPSLLDGLRQEYQSTTGIQAPAGATMLIFEWGEVGKLPFESREKGVQILYDPTPFLTGPTDVAKWEHAIPEPPMYEWFFLFGWLWAGLLPDPFGGPYGGGLTAEQFEIWAGLWSQYIAEESAIWQRAIQQRPSGRIPTYGDAAIRIGGDTIKNGVPIWVSDFPLPDWNLMKEGEALDLTNAGYAGGRTPGTIDIGPGRFGVVPKS